MIETGTENEILGCGMPFDVIHSPLMTVKIDLPLIGVRFHAIARNGPDLHCSIVRTRRNLVVVEWIEFQIDDRTAMSSDPGMIDVDSTHVDQVSVVLVQQQPTTYF